jgi:hypothetical protein
VAVIEQGDAAHDVEGAQELIILIRADELRTDRAVRSRGLVVDGDLGRAVVVCGFDSLFPDSRRSIFIALRSPVSVCSSNAVMRR